LYKSDRGDQESLEFESKERLVPWPTQVSADSTENRLKLNYLIRRIDDLTDVVNRLVEAHADVSDDRRRAEHTLALAEVWLADADARLAYAKAEEAKSAKIKAGMQRFVDREVDRAHRVVGNAHDEAARIVAQAEEAATKRLADATDEEAESAKIKAGMQRFVR
jgi:hypothetical protein